VRIRIAVRESNDVAVVCRFVFKVKPVVVASLVALTAHIRFVIRDVVASPLPSFLMQCFILMRHIDDAHSFLV
jgi:hypothetical protein